MAGEKNPPSAEEVLITGGVISPAVPAQSGLQQFAQDWNALSSAATTAISTGWDQHVAPEIKKFNHDLNVIAADGNQKWSDMSSAVTAAVSHPTTQAMPLMSKILEGGKYYSQGHGGQALGDAAGFAAETAVAVIANVGADIEKKAGEIESGVKKAVDYVRA